MFNINSILFNNNKHKNTSKMEIKEYVIAAARTLPDLGSEEKNKLHMVLGLKTEVRELCDIIKRDFAYKKEIDKVHAKEEIGDLMWYLAGYDTIHSKNKGAEGSLLASYVVNSVNSLDFIPNSELPESESEKDEFWFFKRICEIDKQIIYLFYISYGYANEVISLSKIYIEIQRICEYLGIDLSECMSKNIEKLKVRYPEKFTEELAVNRNTEEERKKLEE
mgnify:CR=1 FL=1